MSAHRSVQDEMFELLESFVGKLSGNVITEIRHINGAGEPALALEILCDKISEGGLRLTEATYLQIERLAKSMGMPSTLWNYLSDAVDEA